MSLLPTNLPKPDLLDTMQIYMIDLQKLIFDFMELEERLNKYNAICLSLPACHNVKWVQVELIDSLPWDLLGECT